MKRKIDELEQENKEIKEKHEKEIKEIKEKLEKAEKENEKLNKFITSLKENIREVNYINNDEYEEEGIIKEGSTSKVKIVHKKEQEKYAKKELSEFSFEQFQRFVQEGEILLKLRHPCIIEIIGLNIGDMNHPPSIFLTLEPQSLETLIKNAEIEESMKNMISVEIVLGMRFIHARNFMHQDLKPSNILITKDFHVRISDFGLAKENVDIMNTKEVGTLRFMAPELLEVKEQNDDDDEEDDDDEGRIFYTNKIDVYSFGITLIYIVTEKYPTFNLKNVINGIPPKFPKKSIISKWVEKLIIQCLSQTAENRPSFTEILEIMKNNNYDLFNDKNDSKLTKTQQKSKEKIETRILEIEAFEYQHRDD